MQVPHVRFTVRRMMVAVVIMTTALWGGWLCIVRLDYLERAERFRRSAVSWAADDASWIRGIQGQEQVNAMEERQCVEAERRRDMVTDASERARWGRRIAAMRADLAWGERCARETRSSLAKAAAQQRHHKDLMRKYVDAASSPWRLVPPDPPAPE